MIGFFRDKFNNIQSYLDPPSPLEAVEVGVERHEGGSLLVLDSLHGPEEVAAGPEDSKHLRHVQGVDGVTGEPAGRDDHVIGLLPEAGGEHPGHITANVVPVEPERLEPVQSGNVSIQGVNVGKSPCLQ